MILKLVKSILRPIKPILMIPYYWFVTLLGFVFFHFFPHKSFVFILSPMRSGSTLLKALLAEAEDVSNLPEIGFFRYNLNKYYFYYQMYKLSSKKIIVLKKPYPGGYAISSNSYVPYFSGVNIKLIILVRSPGDCMNSYQKNSSILEFDAFKDPFDYWCSAYESIFSSDRLSQNDQRIVYYEDLVNYPLDITKQLYSFIGSKRISGTETYSKPDKYIWKWGTDSGGDVIKTLKVIKPDSYSRGKDLNQFAKDYPRILKIKETLDSYESLAIRPKLNTVSK